MDTGRQPQKLIILNAEGTLFVSGFRRETNKWFGRRIAVNATPKKGYVLHNYLINGGEDTCQLLRELHEQGHQIVIVTTTPTTSIINATLQEKGLSFIPIHSWESYAKAEGNDVDTVKLECESNKYKLYKWVKSLKPFSSIPHRDTLLLDHELNSPTLLSTPLGTQKFSALAEIAGFRNLYTVSNTSLSRSTPLKELSRPPYRGWKIGGGIVGIIVGTFITLCFGAVFGLVIIPLGIAGYYAGNHQGNKLSHCILPGEHKRSDTLAPFDQDPFELLEENSSLTSPHHRNSIGESPLFNPQQSQAMPIPRSHLDRNGHSESQTTGFDYGKTQEQKHRSGGSCNTPDMLKELGKSSLSPFQGEKDATSAAGSPRTTPTRAQKTSPTPSLHGNGRNSVTFSPPLQRDTAPTSRAGAEQTLRRSSTGNGRMWSTVPASSFAAIKRNATIKTGSVNAKTRRPSD